MGGNDRDFCCSCDECDMSMRFGVGYSGVLGVLGVWCISVVSGSFNLAGRIGISSRDMVGRFLDTVNTLGLVERNHEYLRI